VALAKAESDAKRFQALFRDGAVSAQQLDAAEAARGAARAQLDEARAHLADLLAGARPEEVRQAEQAVAQARANVEGARLAAANAREALQDRLLTKSQYDAARAALDSSRAQARAAQAQLDLLLAGSRAEDIRALREQAAQAREQLRLASAQRSNAFVRAPTDGVIKTKIAELGETMAAGSPIVVLLDTSQAWLRVYVPENRYGLIRIGQKAEVTVDSFPGRAFQGSVVEIASEPEFTPKNVQTQEERVKLVYGVKILLDNAEGRLKPGMPADAVIRVKD
jgi:HlyD family secretion protein